MPTITIRLTDQEHVTVKQAAEDEGVTLSEFVRAALHTALPSAQRPSDTLGGEVPPPDSIPLHERQQLALLHRILANVLPKDANGPDGDREYQLRRAEVLEKGYTGEYHTEVAGFSHELSKPDSTLLMDILDMFRVITASRARLDKEEVSLDPKIEYNLVFRGFDFHEPLEAQMAEYTEFLMNDGRWTDLQEQFNASDRGNSHVPMLGAYRRMLNEYRTIMATRRPGDYRGRLKLSAEELTQIAQASIHPSHRRHPSGDQAEATSQQTD